MELDKLDLIKLNKLVQQLVDGVELMRAEINRVAAHYGIPTAGEQAPVNAADIPIATPDIPAAPMTPAPAAPAPQAQPAAVPAAVPPSQPLPAMPQQAAPQAPAPAPAAPVVAGAAIGYPNLRTIQEIGFADYESFKPPFAPPAGYQRTIMGGVNNEMKCNDLLANPQNWADMTPSGNTSISGGRAPDFVHLYERNNNNDYALGIFCVSSWEGQKKISIKDTFLQTLGIYDRAIQALAIPAN